MVCCVTTRGLQGVVMTDALYMKGIIDTYSMGEAGVLALVVGDDLLVGPMHWQMMAQTVNAIHQALTSGRLTRARLDPSVRRILLLKLHMG
ncbi:MAG: glycoside hydrolase family 3 N-terminal domain-containing protein [Ktedonobacterales bacterium]